MKTQGNIIPPEMTHPIVIASNESALDKIPDKEFKNYYKYCKEIKQDMDELSEFQENTKISCIK